MIDEQRFMRVLAWLIRNEGVDPEAIERAVESALDMKVSEVVTLDGGEHPVMRRAFCQQMLGQIKADVQ